ncbi:MAG: GDP-mannose 4,6-dehydratase [Pirellulales bacterium]|nr:GDP-mannose 4,6-dehydratase [Pirellulales bacterium]
MTKRYLVTGCAGFIASKVSEFLLLSRHSVVGVDNLDDAYDPRLKQWRLAQLQAMPGFCFRQLDVADAKQLRNMFDQDARTAPETAPAPYDAVIHLAARAGVRASVERPDVYYHTNCDGTLAVLEMCRRFGIAKFLLASTSSLYGPHNPVPYREDADTDRPQSPYAASKKAAETLAYTYHYLHGLDVSVLRYFTVYGPAGRPDMSVFRFVRHIAEDKPLVLFGDGSQQRDFTHVDDIARGTIAALRPLGYEIVNLGAGRPVAISTLITRLGELLGRKPRIDARPAHRADVSKTWADVAKAKKLLDWEPEVSFDKGLPHAIDWYRNHRELAKAIELGDR